MTKKARERKKLSRHIIRSIKKEFNQEALKFISDIYTIEGKNIPVFNNNDEILRLYCQTQIRINQELLCHSHKPISENKLAKLNEVKNLPKSTEIILKSFLS